MSSGSDHRSRVRSVTRRRLLCDIAELQEKPYPNITLHLVDLTRACLLLTPDLCAPLHLTVHFTDDYPLSPPHVTIESMIDHPNVYGSYICASILNTAEGYTPAYTLKGICIQLLSFFASDKLEQMHGGTPRDLTHLRQKNLGLYQFDERHQCPHCQFDSGPRKLNPNSRRGKKEGKQRLRLAEAPEPTEETDSLTSLVSSPKPACPLESSPKPTSPLASDLTSLPDELLLQTTDYLDFEDIMSFSEAWPRMRTLVRACDVIRCRELQCFVMKQTYKQLLLGVGVHVTGGNKIESEFDLLSGKAYHELGIQESVHGIPFTHWLPLPISYPHWRKVHPHITTCLDQIRLRMNPSLKMSNTSVLFAFMNDIVVRFSLDLEGQNTAVRRSAGTRDNDYLATKSTLRHASEKAIESYFHLYHLLLCAATGPGGQAVVAQANKIITSFMAGQRSKTHVPNLGHLLTALHISDVEMTVDLRKAIITEAITRNVVWLLDGKGAGFAELGFLESDDISPYRLKKTFQGSRTSYRLLMFSELFRRTARPSLPTESSRKSLAELRNELFERHGSPPEGAVSQLAAEVRRMQKIDDFPSFMREMGLSALPGPKNFTSVLRDTVRSSVASGYSREVRQSKLLWLRIFRDDTMDCNAARHAVFGLNATYDTANEAKKVASEVESGKLTFFPQRKTKHAYLQGRRTAYRQH